MGGVPGVRPTGTVRLISPGFAQRVGAAAAPAFGRPAARARSQAQLTGSVWLRRAVVVAWIVAGTAVLLLLFSRLFSDAVPVPQGGNAGTGSSFGPGLTSPYQYQTYPRQRQVLPQYPGYNQVP